MDFSVGAVSGLLRTICPWAFVVGFAVFQIPPSPQLLDEPAFRLFFAIRVLALLIGLGLWYFVQWLLRKKRHEEWNIGIWSGAGVTALLLSFLYYLSTYDAEHHFLLLLLLFTMNSLVVGFIMAGAIPLLQVFFKKG